LEGGIPTEITMQSSHYCKYLVGAIAAFGFGASANAATSCVSTTAQLAAAINAAANNGQDDTIYLETGTYLLNSELQYFAAPSETFKLAIIGGFAPGCASGYASSGESTLDGQNVTRMLMISAQGEVDIGRITFAHGKPTQYFGGAVNLSNGSAAPMYIFSSTFVANQASPGSGGAIYLSSAPQGDIYLWSNLFLANSGSGAGAIYAYSSGNTYVTGNTILSNTLVNHTGLGALDLTGNGTYWITNNILWNNEGNDVYDQVGHAHYANNDIGTMDGFAPLSESNDLNVDPGFVGFFSVSPGPASPLINAGLDTAPGGVGGCCDLTGDPRVQGKHVDIGAQESDVLFRDVFGG
jgi:hypothetical protein